MHRISWRDIQKQLDQALNLCRVLGLAELVERSRFTVYRAEIVQLAEALERGGTEAARQAYDRVRHPIALAESAELGEITPFLLTQDPNVLRPKLERILIGPPLPVDEDQNSNRGRNILFELNLAARIAAGGIMPILGERPDLYCEIDGRCLMIECKRPTSLAGARKAIAKARDQLRSILPKARAGTRGVIALSVTKLMNQGDKLFIYSGEESGKARLDAELDRQREALQGSWERVLHGKIIGMVWHVVTPAVDEEIPLPTVAQAMIVHGDGVMKQLLDLLQAKG